MDEELIGEADEIRIWNYARTEVEIPGDMGKVLQGPKPGLLLYYNFDGLIVNKITDESGYGNNAFLNTSPLTHFRTGKTYQPTGVFVTPGAPVKP